ncbi:MAG: hypothetical protein PHE73_05160 [Sulfurovaceae bacterium]|nr:hypothetical protein [Sulfurovaceae bacterium]
MNLLTLVLSSQLLYYLLIVQTGVVGFFNSNVHDLYTLPIGGVLGGIASAILKHNLPKNELLVLFGIQIAISCFYPHYSLGIIFALGFVVGYTTPILLYVFRLQDPLQLVLGLGLSYTIGTALYTYPYHDRDIIAVLLPFISMISLLFVPYLAMEERRLEPFDRLVLIMMMLYIFLDSALFETLSRSRDMDIWSSNTLIIIIFHLAGLVAAYLRRGSFMSHTSTVLLLFCLSYILYLTKQPLYLSVVYPFTISYYNFIVFYKVMKYTQIQNIAFTMVGMGWFATSIAEGIALEHKLWMAFVVMIIFSLYYFRRNYEKNKSNS